MNVSEFLSPELRKQLEKLYQGLARAGRGGRDDEAVHDLRVAIRRLRSLLKPARNVYGNFHTDRVREVLKSVADATGELRDEEVLLQTIGALPLPASLRRDRAAWLALRKTREVELRASLLGLLRSGRASQAADALAALLTLPVNPAHDPPVGPFAAHVVARAARQAERHQGAPLDDAEGLHRLRILYKRLRYASEGFAGALSHEDAGLGAVAERFQKRLGELHDLDVAAQIVSGDLAMTAPLRDALRTALQHARAHSLERYVEERDRGAVPGSGDLRKGEDTANDQLDLIAAHQPPEPPDAANSRHKAPRSQAPRSKAAGRKGSVRKTAARAGGGKTARGGQATGTASRKVAARKKAPASKAPASKAPASKAPAGKAPAGKAPAGKAPASKAPAGKAPAGKGASKRTGKATARKA
jgi:CHAD domain-containing protein